MPETRRDITVIMMAWVSTPAQAGIFACALLPGIIERFDAPFFVGFPMAQGIPPCLQPANACHQLASVNTLEDLVRAGTRLLHDVRRRAGSLQKRIAIRSARQVIRRPADGVGNIAGAQGGIIHGTAIQRHIHLTGIEPQDVVSLHVILFQQDLLFLQGQFPGIIRLEKQGKYAKGKNKNRFHKRFSFMKTKHTGTKTYLHFPKHHGDSIFVIG